MAVTTAEEETIAVTTDGTEQNAITAIAAGGVFFVRLDIDDMAAGDYLEIREKVEALASGTVRLLDGSPMRVRWDAGPIIELPHRTIVADTGYLVTVKRVGGSDFDLVGSIIEVG